MNVIKPTIKKYFDMLDFILIPNIYKGIYQYNAVKYI